MPITFITENPKDSRLPPQHCSNAFDWVNPWAANAKPPLYQSASAPAPATISHYSSLVHISPSPPLAPEHLIHALPTRTITLAGGVSVVFNENDVRTAPSISFARNVKEDFPRLNAMWDDTTHHWGGNSFLHIKDRPIALIYWKAVYTSKQGTGWKRGQWKILKGNVFDWKVGILFYRYSSFFEYLLL